MVPSVGRIVHYQSHGSPNGQHKSLPRAAIITETRLIGSSASNEHDYSVGLCVLNPTGMYFDPEVPYDPEAGPGTWRWPPRV